jgi:hypothetical protein
MASNITTTAMNLGPDVGDDEWGVYFYTTDCSSCEVIKAAPGAGLYLYIDEIYIIGAANITADIGDGEDTNAVETKLFTALGFVDGSKFGPLNLRGQRLTANKALTIDASGAGNLAGHVLGRTGPARTATKDL